MPSWLLLHVSCQLVQVLALCPSPFTMDAGLCVFVNTSQSYTWCSANQQCASIGGELINSHSSIKLLVGRNISSANCGPTCQLWVGLSDIADERNRSRAGWQRVNWNGIFPLDNSLFASDQPNGVLGENCLKSTPLLWDGNCKGQFGFACEYVADPAQTLVSGLWKATAFKRIKYNIYYCFANETMVNSRVECMAAALRAGNSRQVLYNRELGTCVLLQFTDAQVEYRIENSPDWAKFSLH